MLQCKNGRFYVQGASFKLPDSFYLDSDISPRGEDGLSFFSQNEEYVIQYSFNQTTIGAEEELKQTAYDNGNTVLKPITPIEHNGLSGFQSTYRQNKDNAQIYEVHFQVTKSREMIFAVLSPFSEQDIHEIITSPALKAAFDGIQKEND